MLGWVCCGGGGGGGVGRFYFFLGGGGGGRVKGAVSHRWKKQGATPTELVDGFNSSTSLARMLSCAHRIVQFIVIALSRPNDSGKKTASITIKLFQNENCSGF